MAQLLNFRIGLLFWLFRDDDGPIGMLFDTGLALAFLDDDLGV